MARSGILALLLLGATVAGCAGPTPSAQVPFDPSAADAYRPPAPPVPACFAGAATATGSGLDGIDIAATERTPSESVEDAREGILAAQAYLAACLGGDVDAAVRTPLAVDVRSSVNGDERLPVPWEAAWGKETRDAGRIVADAGGRDGFPDAGWSFRADQQKTFAHEYAHIWHQLVGCGGQNPPAPRWFTEGLADHVGYHAGIARGGIERDDARTFLWRAAFFDGQLDAPLSQLGVWPGLVGFFAIEDVIHRADDDPRVLRTICEGTRSESFARGFESALGVSVETFEAEFHARYGAPSDRPRTPPPA